MYLKRVNKSIKCHDERKLSNLNALYQKSNQTKKLKVFTVFFHKSCYAIFILKKYSKNFKL